MSRFPPASHYRYFKKECACVRGGAARQAAAFVKRSAAGTGAAMFSYRCLVCGYTLSDFIPHAKVEGTFWFDLDAHCDSEAQASDLSRVFAARPPGLAAATVLPPAPGELADESIVIARYPRLSYFVDEAGDPTLFGRKRRVVIGTPGCSRTFMVGAACVSDCAVVELVLRELRDEILVDPSLKDIESLKESRKRTFHMFHASKDHRRVRDRVFARLVTLPVQVLVVVRRKHSLLEAALAEPSAQKPPFSWQQEFDSMVTRLFKDRLHLAEHSDIVIARRGASNRDEPLKHAVETARLKFEKKWDVVNLHHVTVKSAEPHLHPGLQVVDYYLWALQRVFERGDFNFFRPLQDAYRLILDVDDHRERRTGAYYSIEHPLTPESIKPFES